MLLATAVYTFLRLLEDHEAAPFKNLRQMEIEFCVSLLREKVIFSILYLFAYKSSYFFTKLIKGDLIF